jgi:hypothetical protein
MAQPRSLVQPFRKNKFIMGAGWRSYFAPYNAALGSAVADTTQGPTILDLTTGPFDQNRVLPTNFFDLGWIKEFKATSETKIGQVRAGIHGAVRAQYKGQIGESFEFKFREYGRLQFKIANGSDVINLMSGATPTTVGPLSASGASYASMVSYDAAGPTLTVDSASGFSVGNYIVCDIDYDPNTYGIVGSAGNAVFPNSVSDVDYIRKTSDYVARIVKINGAALTLDQKFAGGGSGNPTATIVPQAGSKVQKIKGWAAREGGSFISEWTGLFLLDTVDQAQLAVYYPHVSIMAPRDAAAPWAVENIGTTDFSGFELDAQFQALAFDDPWDGETVVGYKCMFLRPGEAPGY